MPGLTDVLTVPTVKAAIDALQRSVTSGSLPLNGWSSTA
jgi:hypothetical protein